MLTFSRPQHSTLPKRGSWEALVLELHRYQIFTYSWIGDSYPMMSDCVFLKIPHYLRDHRWLLGRL